MKIENAICINSEGTIIESFSLETESTEYLLVDLFCLKQILKRTISFKKQPKNIKDAFTRVLKGHIAVATANISKQKTGSNIDKLARKYLKEVKKDFSHGTGHGVGYFLSLIHI